MATRGWESVAQIGRDRRATKTPQKYRNVRVTIDGQTFASKREATYWQGLKAREHNGEIRNLRRQVPFALNAPTGDLGVSVEVSQYLADFVYEDADGLHVVDAKGHATSMFALKAKWLWLQNGIAIEEV